MKKFHFIGIGGIGMSALAKILLEKGFEVSGSDLSNSNLTEQLEKKGAKIYQGHNRENINKSIDKVVYSSAIPKDNIELITAKEYSIDIIQRADVLEMLLDGKKSICVAGSHGKTTTSSMLSLILEKNNVDPTIIIGGELKNINGNSKLGKSDYIVAEADESDGSFLKLKPWSMIITNIEKDHLDHYGNLENLIKAFEEFVGKARKDGVVSLCAEDENVLALQEYSKGKVLTYGFAKATYTAKNIEYIGLKTKFECFYEDKPLGIIKLNIPGKHNILNALGAISIAHNMGLDIDDIAKALEGFFGVHRRFEYIGKNDKVVVYDDYAHHPTEIQATLKAAAEGHQGRVIAVFQPHRYSRTKDLAEEFANSFLDADKVVITDIFAASEKPILGIDSHYIVDKMPEASDVEVVEDINDLPDFLKSIYEENDLIITMGAGDIVSIAKKLL